MILGLEYWVYDDFEHIINHFGEYFSDVVIGNAEVGVIVTLDEPGSEVFIDEEIVAEDFEDVLSFGVDYLSFSTQKGVNDDIFESLGDNFFEIDFRIFFKLCFH